MHEGSLAALEFDKVLLKLSKHAVSAEAKQKSLELMPVHNRSIALKLLADTAEMLGIISQRDALPLTAIHRLRPYIERARVGGALKASDLLEICENMTGAAAVKNYIEKFEDVPNLTAITDGIMPLRELTERIESCILSENTMADGASKELASIRSRMRVTSSRIEDKLRSLITNPNTLKFLQDGIVTIRRDRYVLPVKSEYARSMPGIVHDASASGATLFIEPVSVVDMNNKLSELKKAEKVEIERILRELTEFVVTYADTIINNNNILIQLDFINAKGLFARELDATEPIVPDNFEIDLKKARHPLIDKAKIVPLSLKLGGDIKSVVITGPNTGGKTVALKTMGLMAAMTGAGLFISAGEGSIMSVFDGIYADIGDKQSIEQSLSTFSSHMVNIAEILKLANKNSLVIFDEIGAGTDPEEGASLAEAILEYLNSKGACVLASTHYGELKNYALTAKGVENASMEFDEKTLMPTYRLITGIPGKSNAFGISKRLGLAESIVERAKELAGGAHTGIEDILANLHEKQKYYEEKNAELEKLTADAEAENLRLKNLIARQLEKNEKETELAKSKARGIIKEAKLEAQSLLKEISELKKNISSADDKKLQEIRDRQRAAEGRYGRNVDGLIKKSAKSVDINAISEGDEVYVPQLGQNARVLSADKAKKLVKVRAGQLVIDLRLENIEPARQETSPKSKGYRMKLSESKSVPLQCDLRGMDLESALVELDRYLDDAYLAGYNQVTIVHGLGTMVLKSGVSDFLSGHPHVQKYCLEPKSRGGATVAELKR